MTKILPWLQKMMRIYRRFFSVAEIENSLALKWVFGSLLLSHVITFFVWFYSEVITVEAYEAGTHTCPPYWQSCGEWYFLHLPPAGYSQPLLYMVFFALALATVHLMLRGRWAHAHVAMLPLMLWHAIGILFLSETYATNYQHYLLVFSIIFFFFPHKEFFLKVAVVLLYFLSTAVKVHETWILGTYFSALKAGLPLFPKWSIPIWTNLVIFMEMVAAWWLLSKPGWQQRSVLVFFVVFHLYSGLLVGYRYPTIVLPLLYLLFGVFYRYQPIPFDRKAIVGWTFIVLLCGVQSISHFIPGDEKLTLEGNKYGQYMFEANHQCVSSIMIHYENGETEDLRIENPNAIVRCNPYNTWFRLNQFCRVTPAIERITWTFDHSINGGPFYRIVDTENACALPYHAFGRNEWIKTEKNQPPVVGYPVENIY